MSNNPIDDMSLFEAADFACDLLRACNCGYDESDDVIVFRKLQKDKLPGLSDTQVRDMFNEWAEHYYAKCVLDRADAIDAITRFAEEHAKENPDPNPFRCPCGAETKSADDPDFFAVHGPHIAEAAKARDSA